MHDSNAARHGKLNGRHHWTPRTWRILRLGRFAVLDWRAACA